MQSLLKPIIVFLLVAIACPAIGLAQTTMTSGQEYQAYFMLPDTWKHYRIYVDDWHSDFSVVMQRVAGNPDVYIRKDQQPTLDDYDHRPYLDGDESVELDNTTAIKLTTGWHYISVHARPAADNGGAGPLGGGRGPRVQLSSFKITATTATNASDFTGMGALPFDGGSAFRVWAPFADSVHVSGEFNGWSDSNAQLVSEGNGHWSIEHRGADPGEQYKYVIRNGTQTLWKNDPREEQVTNSVGNSVIFDESFNWTDGSFTMPNWNEMVVYELHIGTLNDAPGGDPGTFDSAIQRLDHIRDLGVNCVCVMPVCEFPGDFSWGYNPSYPFAVEEAYGGPAKFKSFVNECHARGIAVLIDVVHNHYGPTDLDMWQFDGWSENGRGGIYFYQDNRADTQWGDTRPDFGRNEVRQYIRDNVLMWLQDFHCDGIRMDSTLNMRTTDAGDNAEGWSLMQWINDEIDVTQPWKFASAEDLQNNEWITRDTGAGGAGFDSQWSPGFVHPVRAALQAVNDGDRDMNAIAGSINEKYNGDAFQRMIYTESHDEVANGRARVPQDIDSGNPSGWHAQKRSTLGAALVMTAPGVPMLFQGQEVLEDEYFQDTDPVDWSKETTFAGIELMYTDLIRLRRNWFNHTRGLRGQHVNVFHVNNTDKVIAFHRWDNGGAGDDVVVVCNFSTNTRTGYRIGLPQGGVWRVRFNSDWNGYSSIFGNQFTADMTADGPAWDGLGQSGVLDIAPYTAVIFSQDSGFAAPPIDDGDEGPGDAGGPGGDLGF